MEWIYNDGGREAAGYKGSAGDCVCRAIAIATGKPYQEVYDDINEFAKDERITKRHRHRSSARNGCSRKTAQKILKTYGGWRWIPTMQIGSGCKVHLKAEELPKGTLILSLSRHFTCVKDGVIYDTYDCSRDESRCVYGYYIKDESVPEHPEEEVPVKVDSVSEGFYEVYNRLVIGETVKMKLVATFLRKWDADRYAENEERVLGSGRIVVLQDGKEVR